MKDSGKVSLNRLYIGRPHSESITVSNSGVILSNEELGLRVQIIAPDGSFCNFPGIESCPALEQELQPDRIRREIFYSATFQPLKNGHHRMIWTVRPDGRFWMDSWGFGAEDYDSVELYAVIDETGRFLAPFRLYSIGDKTYYQGERDESDLS